MFVGADRMTELDLDGRTDEAKQVRYIGKARKQDDGSWRCLADVSGCLCLVEVSVKLDG